MKKTVLFLIFIILALGCISAYAASDVRVIVNGEGVVFDQPPVIENGRTLVPVRAVTEAMNAEVTWDGNRKAIVINRGGVMVSMNIGVPYIFTGTEGQFADSYKKVPIDTAPAIYGGRTLLPIRAVVEALGGSVYWSEKNRTVYVMTGYLMLEQKTAPNITWLLYSDGTMIVSGIGATSSYTTERRPDWHTQKERIHCVIIESGVTGIGDYAFASLPNLSSVVMSNTVTTIGNRAFSACPKLWDVSFSEATTSIGAHAFYDCRALTSVFLPASVKTIGEYAFAGCSQLASVQLSEGLVTIDRCAFSSNTSLTEITLPSTLKTIRSSCFSKCSALRVVTIPASVTNIETGVFNACPKMQTIYGVPGTEAERVASEKRYTFVSIES